MPFASLSRTCFRTARISLTLTTLASAALLSATPAQVSHVGEDTVVDQQTIASTDQLLSSLRQWENAPEAVRAARLEQLVQRAAARKERLARLIERNPQVAVARLMPTALRDRLPAAARAQVEQEVELQGEVVAEIASDVPSGYARQRFFLRTNGANGNLAGALELKLGERDNSERALLGWAGKQVRLKGSQLDRQLLVHAKRDVQLLAADGTAVTNGSTTPTITPVVTGNQRALVILTNFTDKPMSCSAANVTSYVFGSGSSVHTSMQESSRNLVGFTGTVVGPYNIPYSSTGSCDYSGWGSAAEAAARAAGVDPGQYNRVNYVTPGNGTCGWSGLAYMPGRQSWVQSCGATGIYTHELGHNLALHHAGSPTAEYGDSSDPMGGARNVRNNAANQVMAGWVPTGGVQDVTSGGSFALAALGPEAGTQPQVLRLPKADTNEKYYVSLRTVQGLDSALTATHVNAISVHKASGTLPAKTTLLASLAVGQSYTDSTNGITVNHQGLAGNVATVSVSMGGGSCTRVAPSVSLTPATHSATAGTSVSYSATVVNNNPAACGSATFALSQALPGGFAGSFSPASLQLAAGGSASSTWTVSSGSATAAATYDLPITAAENAVANSRTEHASYVVTSNGAGTADTTGPTLTITSPQGGTTISGRTTLTATASDPSGVARVEFYDGYGKLLASDTLAPYSVSWNLRKATKGQQTIQVRAVDAAGNATQAGVTVMVQ